MRISQFNVIYVTNGTIFFCVDISSVKYEKLKLCALQWYCPIYAKEMPFTSLLNKGFKIFLPWNPFHHIAQVIPPKKVDKCTKDISKKFKDLNQLFDNTENAVNCDYLDINEYKKIKVKEQDFSLYT